MQRSEPPRESERFRGKTGAFSEQNQSETGKRQLDGTVIVGEISRLRCASHEMNTNILFNRVWHAQMRECLVRCLAPFGGAVDEALLEKEGLVNVLDGIDFLTQCACKRG